MRNESRSRWSEREKLLSRAWREERKKRSREECLGSEEKWRTKEEETLSKHGGVSGDESPAVWAKPRLAGLSKDRGSPSTITRMHFEQLSCLVIAITTCHPPCSPRREKRRVRDPAAPFRRYMDSFAASGQKLGAYPLVPARPPWPSLRILLPPWNRYREGIMGCFRGGAFSICSLLSSIYIRAGYCNWV